MGIVMVFFLCPNMGEISRNVSRFSDAFVILK